MCNGVPGKGKSSLYEKIFPLSGCCLSLGSGGLAFSLFAQGLELGGESAACSGDLTDNSSRRAEHQADDAANGLGARRHLEGLLEGHALAFRNGAFGLDLVLGFRQL